MQFEWITWFNEQAVLTKSSASSPAAAGWDSTFTFSSFSARNSLDSSRVTELSSLSTLVIKACFSTNAPKETNHASAKSTIKHVFTKVKLGKYSNGLSKFHFNIYRIAIYTSITDTDNINEKWTIIGTRLGTGVWFQPTEEDQPIAGKDKPTTLEDPSTAKPTINKHLPEVSPPLLYQEVLKTLYKVVVQCRSRFLCNIKQFMINLLLNFTLISTVI